MKISKKCDYACKAILDIGMTSGREKVTSVADISKRQAIPLKYLEQILAVLKKNNLVQSKRGQGGGYILSRPPLEITLAQVVLAVDGPMRPIDCFGPNSRDCAGEAECPFQDIWKEVERLQLELLTATTFDDIMRRKEQLTKPALMYYI